MSYIKKLLLLIVFVFIFLSGRYITSVKADPPKINICHKTASVSNPYEANRVDDNGYLSGHPTDFLYQGPLDQNGHPDKSQGKADNWCNSNIPTQLTCTGDVPSSLLVDASQAVSNDPDSGLHGNWATDAFSKHIRVWGEGNHFCAQTDDTGTFITTGPLSPELGNPLPAGINGTFSGGARYKINGSFKTEPDWPTTGTIPANTCADGCPSGTYSKFISQYFDNSTYSYIYWHWTYISCGHGQWLNADTGNSGDIVAGPTEEVCGQSTPTPTPEVLSSSTSNGSGGGGGGAPQCGAQKPPKPGTLTAEKTSPTTVKLTWSAVTPVTYYAISYGTDPNNFQFGVPNVGNSTSFVVGALNPNLKYYFKVIAVNDCMPSDPTAEVSPGGVLGASTEKVLGASTDRLAATDSDLYLPRIMVAAVFFVLSLTSGVKFLHGSKKS